MYQPGGATLRRRGKVSVTRSGASTLVLEPEQPLLVVEGVCGGARAQEVDLAQVGGARHRRLQAAAVRDAVAGQRELRARAAEQVRRRVDLDPQLVGLGRGFEPAVTTLPSGMSSAVEW